MVTSLRLFRSSTAQRPKARFVSGVSSARSQVALASGVKSFTTGSKSSTWSWRSVASRWARPFSRSFWRWAEEMSVMCSAPGYADRSGPFASNTDRAGVARSRIQIIGDGSGLLEPAHAVTVALRWRGGCVVVGHRQVTGQLRLLAPCYSLPVSARSRLGFR